MVLGRPCPKCGRPPHGGACKPPRLLETLREKIATDAVVGESGEPTYACDRCGKRRTKAEGGTTFTVCDKCWDDIDDPPPAAPAGEAERLAYVDGYVTDLIALQDRWLPLPRRAIPSDDEQVERVAKWLMRYDGAPDGWEISADIADMYRKRARSLLAVLRGAS